MPATVEQRYTLTADGMRSYTFTPLGSGTEVEIRFARPQYASTCVTIPALEARELWARLLKQEYERW